MYILLFIYWIELILCWSSINLDSFLWYQNFCLLYRFYIVTLSYSIHFPPFHNAFCLYKSSLVYVFFFAETINDPSSILNVHLLEVHWNIMTLHDFIRMAICQTHIFPNWLVSTWSFLWYADNENKYVIHGHKLKSMFIFLQFCFWLIWWPWINSYFESHENHHSQLQVRNGTKLR